MHLKSYEIDGATLHTGSSNFSASGENAQDNDLIVIRDSGAGGRFEAHFAAMGGRGAGDDRICAGLSGRWSRDDPAPHRR
jgi:phosphatidylserine/phosphatidylglycerophosphate/cardiolipin synthase-like enzyme